MLRLAPLAFVCALAVAPTAHAETTEELLVITPADYLAGSFAPGGFPASFPVGVGTLSEPAIESGFVLTTKVRSSTGAVCGFGSEQADIDFDALVSHATWTLTLPGRGTLFLAQDEDLALLFQILGEMIAGGELERSYDPPLTVVTTIGIGEVIGGTGEFEGARGTFREVDDVHFLSLATGALQVTDRLELSLKLKSR